MAEGEARQVLGVTEHASWEEIVQVCLIDLFFFHSFDLPAYRF